MEGISSKFAIFFLSLFLSSYGAVGVTSSGKIQTYIVHLQRSTDSSVLSTENELVEWYKSFLPPTTEAEGKPSSSRLIHSYKKIVTGFAARLTEAELTQIKNKTEFVHAHPDMIVPLATTHTPGFLGLSRDTSGFWNDSNYGSGVIIGVLDTGIAPDHPSFSDAGMPPPPAKWKGVCEFNASSCNNKLIGARNFIQGLTAMRQASRTGLALQPPYDDEGHGTHTSSTAAGAFVGNANVGSQANGTASGIAPLAHVAMYKVCGEDGCASSDILAALDAAVGDGVDVLSLSLGGPSAAFYNDVTAIGTLAAIEHGIFVSCAAMNNGPDYSTLSNEAPWILTVGASTTDRSIRSFVKLGTGDEFVGESLYQPTDFPSTMLPLIYPGSNENLETALCTNGSLDNFDVRGKVVICDDNNQIISRVDKGVVVSKAGGAAMILANLESRGFVTRDDVHVLPAAQISYAVGLAVKIYVTCATSPTASITFNGTVFGTVPAPMVADFSSRGPNRADPNILKPDIIGPGVNILAAWPFQVEATNVASTFNIISGTSMSTPHLSGIAALLKSSHPDWSPAAIKSAIMTSANSVSNAGTLIPDQTGRSASFFAIGSGHVNVAKANNPGLVYDITSDDYIAYLCGLGYTDNQVSVVARRKITCSDVTASELNYPSFMVFLTDRNKYTAVVTRTVTNVGAASSEYTAEVATPIGTWVTVKPEKLSFSKVNEIAQYSVTFVGNSNTSTAAYSKGYLKWNSKDNTIGVNSPIMVALG